jgi:16S rRNA (cytosine1402-N4)-methyltransferase
MQLDQGEKGFSFSKEGPLDMRMDPEETLTAREIVNRWSQEKLEKVFREYGEEKRWKLAAKIIVEARKKISIETTKQLADLIASSLGKGIKKKLHPATLIFQGLRICVNKELEAISAALPKAIQLLRSGGRIGVMSFHRLEDSIVKNLFKEAAARPVKRSGDSTEPVLQLLTKKPLMPRLQEIRSNSRARSAKLRFAGKL